MLEYFTKNTNLQEGALDFFRIHLGFSVKEYTKKSFTAAQIFGSQFKDSPSFKAVEAGFVGHGGRQQFEKATSQFT